MKKVPYCSSNVLRTVRSSQPSPAHNQPATQRHPRTACCNWPIACSSRALHFETAKQRRIHSSRFRTVMTALGGAPSGRIAVRYGNSPHLRMDPRSPRLRSLAALFALALFLFSHSHFPGPVLSSLFTSLPLFCPTLTFTPSLSSPYLSSYLLRLFVIYRWLKLMVCSSLNHTEQFPSSSSPRGHSSCVQ